MLRLHVDESGFYKSLVVAYELSIKDAPSPQIENALWKAFSDGLLADRNQTIVLDGLDHLTGGDGEKLKLLEQLHAIVSKHSKTKCVVFSRALPQSPKNYAHFSIELEHTAQDMLSIAEYLTSLTESFENMSEKQRETLISTLVKTAAGSFGWLGHAFEILKIHKTPDLTLKAAGALPHTFPDLVGLSLNSIDLKNRDTKAIMAWLLSAERPLLVREIRELIELDTSSCSRLPRSSRSEDDIIHALGPLVEIKQGLVRFRHTTIRENLLERAAAVTDFKNTGPFPFSIKEAHYDIVIRCMAYVKICKASYLLSSINL